VGQYMLLDLCPCLARTCQHTFVSSFLEFKSRNYTNGGFRVKAKGVTYERVHTDIGLYMCVHIIQRYDDTMKDKGGEGRERKERDICI